MPITLRCYAYNPLLLCLEPLGAYCMLYVMQPVYSTKMSYHTKPAVTSC